MPAKSWHWTLPNEKAWCNRVLVSACIVPDSLHNLCYRSCVFALADCLPELSTAAYFTPRIVPLHSGLAVDRSRSRLKASHGVINVLRWRTCIKRCDPVSSKMPDIGLLVLARRLGPSPSHVLKLALCSAPGASLAQSQRFVKAEMRRQQLLVPSSDDRILYRLLRRHRASCHVRKNKHGKPLA